MVEHIKANAKMTIQQMRPLNRIDFGYTRESVEWLEGYIERLRQSGEFQAEATKDKLVSVFGSFLGECIVRCYGGVWAERGGLVCRLRGRQFCVSIREGLEADGARFGGQYWEFVSRRARGIQGPCACAALTPETLVEILVRV